MWRGFLFVNKNRSPSPEGVLDAATISAMSSRKTGRLSERLVGYDCFEGLLTSSTTQRTLSGAAGLCALFSTLHETPSERTRGKSKCGAPTIRPKRRCNDSLRLRSCRPKSSKNCFGSLKRWTRSACLRSSNTYRKRSGGTLPHLPQNRLHLLLRFSFPCSSVQKKRFLSMRFLIHLRPCSKERARKSIKRPGGLMIGARARTLSKGNGNRLRPGYSLIQNSQA